MKTKTQNMVVFALFAGAIAFSSYKLYKTYKEVKERNKIEEEVAKETFIDEAHKELEEAERLKAERETLYREDLELMQKEDEERLLQEEELEDFYNEPGIEDDEEMIVLLYPPNSIEAKEQYINMKLAEIDSQELRDIMVRLYQEPLVIDNCNEYDKDLMETIQTEKAEFFGDDSIFVKEVWAGDIIMYFAYLAQFDLDEEIEDWVQLFIDNLGITHDTSLLYLNTIIGEFLINRRATKAGFGMFGLERIDLDEITEKNIETLGFNGLTLRAQYNAFILNVMGEW